MFEGFCGHYHDLQERRSMRVPLQRLLEDSLTEHYHQSLRAALSKWSGYGITDRRTDHEVDLGGPILVQEIEG